MKKRMNVLFVFLVVFLCLMCISCGGKSSRIDSAKPSAPEITENL